MTEYEAASLALQKSALALQQASLAAQQASVWVAAFVGAAQCSLIGIGLYIMRQASKQRDAQHQENMAQHRETMKALETQREAQSEQHRETMKALEGQHKALENQSEALRELIRRTSAPSAQEDG
ncbi:MAG: hypothetical protein OXE44_16815 [Nitrospinae bacterium]|nr:hypothetical protein [Nitrospinota bacterium]